MTKDTEILVCTMIFLSPFNLIPQRKKLLRKIQWETLNKFLILNTLFCMYIYIYIYVFSCTRRIILLIYTLINTVLYTHHVKNYYFLGDWMFLWNIHGLSLLMRQSCVIIYKVVKTYQEITPLSMYITVQSHYLALIYLAHWTSSTSYGFRVTSNLQMFRERALKVKYYMK